jgi:hypothetical protein
LSSNDLTENLSIDENDIKYPGFEVIPRLNNRIIFIPPHRPFHLITPERINSDYSFDHSISFALVIIFDEK